MSRKREFIIKFIFLRPEFNNLRYNLYKNKFSTVLVFNFLQITKEEEK